MSNQDVVDKVAKEEGILIPDPKLTRDELRAKVFDSKNKKPKYKVITFFGVMVELRQGTLSSILAPREDNRVAIVDFLINNAYLPGTEEKAFEDGDSASFLAMPFGEDFVKVTQALEELSGVNFLKPSAS